MIYDQLELSPTFNNDLSHQRTVEICINRAKDFQFATENMYVTGKMVKEVSLIIKYIVEDVFKKCKSI